MLQPWPQRRATNCRCRELKLDCLAVAEWHNRFTCVLSMNSHNLSSSLDRATRYGVSARKVLYLCAWGNAAVNEV